MKHTEIHEENQVLKKKLTDENQQQFDKIEHYIQYGNTMKSPLELETRLNDFLHEVIKAQENGLTVDDYVNHQPKVFADHFLSKLAHRPQEIFKIVGIFILIIILLNFAFNDFRIDVFGLIMQTIYIALGLEIFKKFKQWEIFSEVNEALKMTFLIVLSVLFFAIWSIVREQLTFLTWTICFSFNVYMAIAFLSALAVTLLRVMEKNKSRVDWLIIMSLVWGLWVIGIVNYI
ncbi:hypothetical protein [Marinilactibacillus kalidii]|uniref:hypothetical protein n=1 Tax=Marinilactibacillus kalidii TaxID=2820274 RepID=UPI001ABEC74C|nr:hypothetical protein [Marinilactibacillus kalidii]